MNEWMNERTDDGLSKWMDAAPEWENKNKEVEERKLESKF